MFKYVYCHDSGEYDEYTALKKSDGKIFGTLRANTNTGTFLYAPTTLQKAILFAFSQSNGQFRVDGYKGELSEIGANPAAYIGNLTVEKPYLEELIGALPVRLNFNAGDVDATRMANLAQYVIWGDLGKDIVILGEDITRRAAEYLKYLYLLFPAEYARKVGFCINKYLKNDLEDQNKFLPTDEKPIVRIYALDSQKEFAGSYKINLDVAEKDAKDISLGAKALRDLIKRGVTQSNFNEIFNVTESAFSADGDLNLESYSQRLIRCAYENFRTAEYAEAIVSCGFKNDDEKRLFVDCVNCCLRSGDQGQKRTAANKAIELLQEDISLVASDLFAYVISQQTVTPSERDFLVRSTVAQLSGNGNGDEDLLGMYLHAVMPTWKQKYEFITDVIQRLYNTGDKLTAHNVCKILSQRFNRENLAYAKDITTADLFTLKSNMDPNVKEAIFAALLQNECNASGARVYARAYLKKEPTFGDILNVRRKIREIFDDESGDFLFGDAECERIIRDKIGRLDFVKLFEIYDGLSTRLADYPELKAEFLTAMLKADKLKKADASFLESYRGFLTDVEADVDQIENASGKTDGVSLTSQLQECKSLVFEKESDREAQARIQEYCGGFIRKLNEMLSEKEHNEISNVKKSGSAADAEEQPVDYQKVIAKYSVGNSMGLNFNGKQSYGYGIALALLAGFITGLLMFIPAICLAAAVGDLSFAAFTLYLSRYFYVAMLAAIVTVALYALLYFTLCKRKGGATFGVTALCAYVPCITFCLGYVLTFILFT